jgi:ribonuclease R
MKRRAVPRSDPVPPESAWRTLILEYIAAHPQRPLRGRALARELGIPHERSADFREVLRALLAEGTLARGRGRTLATPSDRRELVGVFRAHRDGYGFVRIPNRPDDVFIPRGMTRDAQDGDSVAVRFRAAADRGHPRGPAGEVARIISRGVTQWIGLAVRESGRVVVRAQGRTPRPAVLLGSGEAERRLAGQLVLVRPTEGGSDYVRGEAVTVIGDPGLVQSQIRAAIVAHGLPETFSDDVLGEAGAAAAVFSKSVDRGFSDREDLRELLTITIDPPDARDLDDAISIEPLAGKGMRLGVHIADVAHFVPAGGALDREALRRGNSVYFPGNVLPMLPHELSAGVCSLQPGVPRLTRSVFVDYDAAGKRGNVRFAAAVIRSAARLTYVQASAALADAADATISPPVLSLLRRARSLAQRIERRRRAAGMISLTIPEVHLEFDAGGRPIRSGPTETSYSHTLIEMFMVEANEVVAEALESAGLPQIRRVHDAPDEAGERDFGRAMQSMGAASRVTLDRRAIQELIEQSRGHAREPALHRAILRSMAQAKYAPTRRGHFALASRDYSHFTSPIRRYADLVNHRMLARAMGSRLAVPSAEELTDVSAHITQTERTALDATRLVDRAMLYYLHRDHVGETFEGAVVGVVAAGVFVQLEPSLADGFMAASDFGGRWAFERDSLSFVSLDTQRRAGLGYRSLFRIVGADDLTLELRLVVADSRSFGRAVDITTGGKRTKRSRPEKTPRRKKRGHQGP